MHKCSSSCRLTMRRSRLTAAPANGRTSGAWRASYAVNELGDWMGIVALSVLVFDRTGSALATAALFLGTRFLPALLAPILVARVEQPPPRFALPVIYCGEAAAFGGLALLAGNDFSLAAVIVLATIDGALALTGRGADPGRGRGPAGAERRTARRQRRAQRRLHRRRRARPRYRRAGRRRLRRAVRAAARRRSPSTRSPGSCSPPGPLPQAEPEPGQMRERVRAGIAYIREQADAAPAADRPGRRLRLLRRGDPDRGRSTPRRRSAPATPATGSCSPAGASGWCSAASSSPPCARAPLPILLFFSTLAVGVGYLGLAAAPTLAARLRRLGRRRRRQRGAVGRGDQRRAGADRAGHAGAGDERARVDRRRDARRRLSSSAA